MGLANRLVEPGQALAAARALAQQLCRFPQGCMRADRHSCYQQWSLPWSDALRAETAGGMAVIESGETAAGAQRFSAGAGRHGKVE